jgi:hypothetical protein
VDEGDFVGSGREARLLLIFGIQVSQWSRVISLVLVEKSDFH